MESKIEVEEFIATRVAKGEVVFLRPKRVLSEQEILQISAQLNYLAETAGVTVVLLPNDMEIEFCGATA